MQVFEIRPSLYSAVNQKCSFGFGQTLSTIVVTEKKDQTYSYIDLVRTPKMRKLAFKTGLLWSVFLKVHYVHIVKDTKM